MLSETFGKSDKLAEKLESAESIANVNGAQKFKKSAKEFNKLRKKNQHVQQKFNNLHQKLRNCEKKFKKNA